MGATIIGIPVHICSYILLLAIKISIAVDTINRGQSIKDGESVVSAGGSFRLGFFSPGDSENRYLGIWFNKVSVMTVVWVANRETPLANTSGILELNNQGILVLHNPRGGKFWSSNSSRSAGNPVAQLLDSGNLIVKDGGDSDPENFIWQSFDHPCDTLLSGMKMGRNVITGLDRRLSSWKTPDDPSPGNYSYGIELGGYPEIILRENSVERYRAGPWNGVRFSGTPQLNPNSLYKYEFVFNEEEIYYHYQLLNSSLLTKFVLNPSGLIQRFMWNNITNGWVLYLTSQVDNCDQYATCGAYGSCDINKSPVCACLKGFLPNSQSDWDKVDWSGGCVRRTPLNCSGDGFKKYSGVKLPETRNSWFNRSTSLQECESICRKNCSCTAYANMDIREGGTGCFLWFNDLIDIRELMVNGEDLYIRMAASELDNANIMEKSAKSSRKKHTIVVISSLLSTGLLFLGLALPLYVWKKKQQKARKTRGFLEGHSNGKSQEKDLDLPLFDLDTIARATNNFSVTNVLGKGGFGPVYKGVLNDGQEIAVKRLSKNSRQGLNEFRSEVMHIAKLQHRNLVKLLGCCIQADETMLIYEFMPNKSLDFFIFDETRDMLLDWPKRYNIISGIARGLLYLHQDSRLRIIHRDLKASNILLDYDMNPKISDFGLARSIGGNETEANTNKVVGTYGYMSPEYAIDGLYSVKSDVFSFGVMVIEIVSGKRNRGFYHPDHHLNLLGHAWKLHEEDRILELIPASIRDSCNLSEMLRSVHVGLLCVQRSPEDRPSMSSVVLMLAGEGALPPPKQPGFFTEREVVEASSSSSNHKPSNEITISLFEPR